MTDDIIKIELKERMVCDMSKRSELAKIDKEMGLKPRGRIKVVSEKIFIKGEPFYKVKYVEAAAMNDLPPSYLDGYPHCYYVPGSYNDPGYLDVYWIENGTKRTNYLKPGKVYKVQQFEMIMKQIKEAGERLATMIEEWRKMCFDENGVNTWKGTRIDVI